MVGEWLWGRLKVELQISPLGLLHSSYSCFCPLVEKIYSCVAVHVFVCI